MPKNTSKTKKKQQKTKQKKDRTTFKPNKLSVKFEIHISQIQKLSSNNEF